MDWKELAGVIKPGPLHSLALGGVRIVDGRISVTRRELRKFKGIGPKAARDLEAWMRKSGVRFARESIHEIRERHDSGAQLTWHDVEDVFDYIDEIESKPAMSYSVCPERGPEPDVSSMAIDRG